MKTLLTLTFLVLCLSVKGQNTKVIHSPISFIVNTDKLNDYLIYFPSKDSLYIKGDTVALFKQMYRSYVKIQSIYANNITTLDTIHHDRKGDFNVIIHGPHKDTVRNGIYEYRAIKKRVKNK